MKDIKIFISYSHEDTELFRAFKKQIENHSKNSKQITWNLWSDVEIPVGSLWHETIQNAVRECQAAILLVSASFFASDYIKNEEFLKFVEKNKREDFTFFPILLSDCDFSQWEELVKIQFFNPKGRDYGVNEFKNKIVPYNYIDKQKYKDTYHKNCVIAFENAVLNNRKRQQLTKTSDTPLIEVLSNENVLNALRLFQEQTQTMKKELTQRELEEAIDFKIKLYNAIFHEFDTQLEKKYSKESSFAIFDRTIAFEQIQTADINLIQKFRNNKSISYRERSLLVSGLTISVLNNFDINKVHLLLDFITDFEDEVWQKALVGLLLAIIRYNNRLSLSPEILRRFQELQQIPNVQEGIKLIDTIIRYKQYSPENNQDYIINIASMILGNTITINTEDILDLEQSYNEAPNLVDNKMIANLFPKDKIEELSRIIEIEGSVTMGTPDFLKYLNFEKFIELYGLNPFLISFNNSKLYKTPQNWFYPFEASIDIENILISDFPQIDIDAKEYISIIQSSNLPEIEKFYILTHIKEFSEDFLYTLAYNCWLISYLEEKNSSNSKNAYFKILRDLYRFNKLSVIDKTSNLLEDKKITLYKKSLLQKITDSITKSTIEAKHLYDNKEYQESIKVLENISPEKYDLGIYAMFVNNYTQQEKYNEALPYLLKLIENLDDDISLDTSAAWYAQAAMIYEKTDNKAKELKYLEKESLIREKILIDSLDNDVLEQEKAEKIKKLVGGYINLVVKHYNPLTIYLNNAYSKSFYYTIKYLNVFFIISNLNNDNLQKEIQFNSETQKSVNTIFNMDFLYHFLLIKPKLKQELEPLFYDRLLNFFEIFEIKIDSIKQSKFYKEIMKYTKEKWDTIKPIAQDIKKQQPTLKNFFVTFTDGIEHYSISFDVVPLLERQEIYVLETLLYYIKRKKEAKDYKIKIDIFLENLLSKETPSYPKPVEIDNILKEMLNMSIIES